MGQSKLSSFPSLEAAKKDFEKKFRDKTKNSWADRENFVAYDGKYTLIEVHHGDEEEQEVSVKVNGHRTWKEQSMLGRKWEEDRSGST